jgi:hypothetical protein
MTVSTSNAISGPFFPNGVTSIFPFTFTALSEAEVEVISISEEGVFSVVSPTLYTVARTIGGGGTITFAPAPASGPSLYFRSNPFFTQNIAFEEGGKITAAALNLIADRAAVRDQFLKEQLDRAVKAEVGQTPVSMPDLYALLQIALAITGPIYASTALGVARTTSGQEFAVAGGEGIVEIWLNEDDAAVDTGRRVVINPASPLAASLIGTASGSLQSVVDNYSARLARSEEHTSELQSR